MRKGFQDWPLERDVNTPSWDISFRGTQNRLIPCLIHSMDHLTRASGIVQPVMNCHELKVITAAIIKIYTWILLPLWQIWVLN